MSKPVKEIEENVKKIVELQDMQIHASRYVGDNLQVIRVPGGWIYMVYDMVTTMKIPVYVPMR